MEARHGPEADDRAAEVEAVGEDDQPADAGGGGCEAAYRGPDCRRGPLLQLRGDGGDDAGVLQPGLAGGTEGARAAGAESARPAAHVCVLDDRCRRAASGGVATPGHEDIGTTSNVYGHLDRSSYDDAAAAIGKVLG
ncbi:hypothetical protein RVF84_03085 [Gordonia malaquae]